MQRMKTTCLSLRSTAARVLLLLSHPRVGLRARRRCSFIPVLVLRWPLFSLLETRKLSSMCMVVEHVADVCWSLLKPFVLRQGKYSTHLSTFRTYFLFCSSFRGPNPLEGVLVDNQSSGPKIYPQLSPPRARRLSYYEVSMVISDFSTFRTNLLCFVVPTRPPQGT